MLSNSTSLMLLTALLCAVDYLTDASGARSSQGLGGIETCRPSCLCDSRAAIPSVVVTDLVVVLQVTKSVAHEVGIPRAQEDGKRSLRARSCGGGAR